jgi:tetratricopeptide (TPR) repeat protein
MISLGNARWQFQYKLANLLLRFNRYEGAANAYGRALSLRPGDPHLQFQRAWTLLHVPQRRGEGISAFQNLMQSSPSASGYYLMACALQQESRHEEAVRAFQEAARLQPSENGDFHYNYASSLRALHRLEEAADAYQTAAHLNPSDGEAWGNLGEAFAELGRWKDAAPCQQRAMRLAPSLVHGLNLGSTLYELGRLEEAERVLRNCLVIDPGSIDAKEALAVVLTGQDRYDDALTLTQQLCAVSPIALSSQVVLAGVLMEAGRLDEALREALTAAEAHPSDPRPQASLGFIYVKMNHGTEALAAFERFRTLLDESTERPSAANRVLSATGRGNALSVLGRHEEAIAAFEEALRIDPRFFERWPEMLPHYERSSQETQRAHSSDEARRRHSDRAE